MQWWFAWPTHPIWSITLACGVFVSSLFGDLIESSMKREAKGFVEFEATRTTKADDPIKPRVGEEDFYVSLADMQAAEQGDVDVPPEFVADWYR